MILKWFQSPLLLPVSLIIIIIIIMLLFLKVSFHSMLITSSPSRAIMYKSGSQEDLSVETVARDGICQIFLLKYMSFV
jgi:hypothetical protein